jgi:hypothetical protein
MLAEALKLKTHLETVTTAAAALQLPKFRWCLPPAKVILRYSTCGR